MSETADRDRGLLSLIERLVKRPEPSVQAHPATIDDGKSEGLDPIVPEQKPAITLEPQLAVESTRTMSRTKLADLLLKSLQAGDGCPDKGFEITVYGARPWNAMLRVTPAAGPVKADAWRNRLQSVVQLFRDQYDIEDNSAE